MYRVADTKGGLSGEVVLLWIYNTSCHGYQWWSKGGGGIVKRTLYRFADTKDVLRGMVIVKSILYRVADTKGGLKGEGFS